MRQWKGPAGRRVAMLVVATGCSWITPAWAQGNEESERPAAETIIVTAERRATNLQDTPLSIVAMNETMLEARGIEDLADLSSFTPNLNITPSRGTGNAVPNFSIRGISGGSGATGERGVGLYIDGVFVPRTSGSVLRVLDIDRIEVLRGPQGTLFGRNSTGGAIRIFTKQPDLDEFGGYLRVTAGSFDRTDIVGTLNVPLAEGLAARAQGAYLKQDGYVSRGDQMLGGSEDIIGRINLRYKPDDRFDATLGFLYTDTKADGTPLVFTEFDMRPGIEGVIEGNFADWLNDAFKQAGQAPLAEYNDDRIVIDDFTAPSICLLDDFNPDYDRACTQEQRNKYWQADLRMAYDLNDDLTLSTTTGLARMIHRASVDYQLLGTENRLTDVSSTVFYQELQLNAALFGGALDLVGGLNYFHEKSASPGLTINRRGSSIFPDQPRGDADGGLFRLTDTYVEQASDSFGVFASGTWHITDSLNFTGGLRYANDRKKYDETEQASANFTPAAGTTSTTVFSDHSWDQIDWRATLDYHFSDRAMIYATASKAYKAGQFSFQILDRVAGKDQSGDFIQPIAPEKVQNYELGMRIEAFDRRVRLNPTVFFMQWTNRQAARQVACNVDPTCPIGFQIQVVNSGDVDLYGAEADLRIAVTDNFFLDASGAIIGYDLKDEVANAGPNLYPDVPETSFNLGATYNARTSFGEFSFNLAYSYTGEQATHNSAVGDSAYTLPAIELVNARIQFQPDDTPVRVTVFANNLLDNTYATYAQRFGGGYWDQGGPVNRLHPLALPERSALAEVRGRPREVGITMQYDF